MLELFREQFWHIVKRMGLRGRCVHVYVENSQNMSKILRICKPVCPNFDIDNYRGKLSRLARALQDAR